MLDVAEQDRADRTWGNDVLMQVQGIGAFVRILIPIKLTGGYTLTFGAWLGVSPQDLQRAFEVWWEPSYADLRLTGVLANMLPGWEADTYRKPLDAAVLEEDAIPYAVTSSDDFMRRVIGEEWPHEPILRAIAPFEER